MISLEQTFSRYSFKFEIKERRGRWLILEKTKKGWKRPSYEVVKTQVMHSYKVNFDGIRMEIAAKEVLPSSEDWGMYGFTYQSFEDAKRKFDAIQKSLILEPPLE